MDACSYSRGMRATGRAAVIVALLGPLTLGCAALRPPPEMKGGMEVGLRRGAGWTTYTVRPPHIVGPMGTLQLRHGHLSGTITNRPVSVDVTEDGLSGSVGGNVEIDIVPAAESLEVSGVWNDERVHFSITPEALRGTITGSTGDGFERRRRRRLNDDRPSTNERWQCQYVLDRLDGEGNRIGVSICSGLPEQTLLEFPVALERWLSRNEMVAVLLVLLASSTSTPLEEGF
jgi:hypothetical protein